MADETRRDLTPEREGATQNRDRRHEPPIIEGEVARSEDAAESTTPESDSTAKPAAGAALSEDGAESAALGSDAKLGGEPSPPSARQARRASARPGLSAAARPPLRPVLAAARAAGDDAAKALTTASASPSAPRPDEASAAASPAQPAAPDVGALQARIGKLETDLATLSRLMTPSAAPPAADVGALEERIGKLEADAATLSRLSASLDPIGQRLAKVEQALAAPQTANRLPAEAAPPKRDGARLAVVAEALRARLAAGAPFPLEAAALEHLGADPAKLAILKPLAEKGAPSAATLAADFAKVASAALAAATPEKSGGVIDRLFANMGKVVKVTPVGEVAGDDPTALISQINAALGRGDAASALAAWGRLPHAARPAPKAWAAEANPP